ncbi:hypothetical protein ACFLXQ_05305 [Chloroflexota bacterium]
MSEKREFQFRRNTLFTSFTTALWILISAYFLWRIGQVIAGHLPLWVALVAGAGLVYMWTIRLVDVRTIVVGHDGRVIFIRGLGRREVRALDIKSVRPLFNISRRNFVLKHVYGSEFLFENPTLVAAVVREFVELNPELIVRGVPAAPGEEEHGGA